MEFESTVSQNKEIRKPKPSIIRGQIIKLSYQESGSNLVEIKVQEDNSQNIFTLTAYCDVELNYATLKINNLDEFQFRLQEAFNYQFLVDIYCENHEILLLEISKVRIQVSYSIGGYSPGTTPSYPPPPPRTIY